MERRQEGLEKFNASAPGTYDLILMDIMMPVMNGLEAAEKTARSTARIPETVPIFAMTANAFSDDAARSRQSRYERAPHKAARP